MTSRLRSTLRGKFWRAQLAALRHCHHCGGVLKKTYVPAEQMKRLVCVLCGQITYTNPKVVTGVIPVLSDGRIVLLQRDIEPAKGRWSYPAGYMELGESVEAAARRETKEEICVPVRLEKLVGIYSYPDAGVVTIVYVGSVPKKAIPQPGMESQSVKIFSKKNIPWDQLAFRSTTEALRDWLRCDK